MKARLPVYLALTALVYALVYIVSGVIPWPLAALGVFVFLVVLVIVAAHILDLTAGR